ncbi:MAG TPA: vgr related protein [Allosphingosinicella sp.]
MPGATRRCLTAGEIALARSVFGDAIDYAPVRLVRRRWFPFQPKDVVMAPMGHIHFHPQGPHWTEDFAAAPVRRQGLLIHELTHVWQSQTRGRWYLVLMRHPFCRYKYGFEPGRRFEGYGLEQQAEIVRHVFLLRRSEYVEAAPPLPALEAILPFHPA